MTQKVKKAFEDFATACYNADCNKGLTGYNTTLVDDLIEKIKGLSEDEAIKVIDSYYDLIQH